MGFSEHTTIAEVKRALTAKDNSLDAKDIRLLWRYNELNDKATLEYYRIPTNAKITVTRRPNFDFLEAGKDKLPSNMRDDRKVQAVQKEKSVRAENEAPRKSRPHSTASAVPSTKERPSSAPKRPTPRSRSAAEVLTRSSAHTYATESRVPNPNDIHYTVGNRPRPYYELTDSLLQEDAEVARLRRTVQQLQEQVREQVQDRSRHHTEDQRVFALEKALRDMDQRYADALQRIRELEATVSRYQSLLSKATQMGIV
jgi:hypothetical protein